MGLGLDNFEKSESRWVSVSTTLENQIGLETLKLKKIYSPWVSMIAAKLMNTIVAI